MYISLCKGEKNKMDNSYMILLLPCMDSDLTVQKSESKPSR
jgi:hypothetical protein